MSSAAFGGRGVDPKLRDAALEAARRHGLPLGDWVSQAVPGLDAPPLSGEDAAREDGDETESSPLQTRRLLDAINRLSQRLTVSEQRAALAQAGLDQGLVGLASRLEDTEAGARDAILRLFAAFGDIKGEAETLGARLEETAAQTSPLRAALDRLEAAFQPTQAEVDALRERAGEAMARADSAETEARLARARADSVEADARRADLRLAMVEEAAAALPDQVANLKTSLESDLATARARLDDALGAAEQRLAQGETALADALARLDHRFEAADQRTANALADLRAEIIGVEDRFTAAEATASAAMRTLETSYLSLGERLDALQAETGARDEIESLRAAFDARLDDMAAAMDAQIGETKAAMSDQLVAALGAFEPEEINAAVADVNRRIAAAERRHAQTIEAVSVEIRRLSEAMDRRMRAIESRNDDGAAVVQVREDVGAALRAMEGRMAALAAAAPADAIERLAHMSDRLAGRQDQLTRDLASHLARSEERAGARLADALQAMGARLAEIDARTQDALAPVGAALVDLTNRVRALEPAAPLEAPTPQPVAAPDVDLDDPFRDAELLDPIPAELSAPLPAPLGLDAVAGLDADEPPAEESIDLDTLAPPSEPAPAPEPVSAPSSAAEPDPIEADMFDPLPDSAGKDWSTDLDDPLDRVPGPEPEELAKALAAANQAEPFDAAAPTSPKESYLAAARRAALAAQAGEKGRGRKAGGDAKAKISAMSLAAPVNVAVMAGAGVAVAAAIAGGVYLSQQRQEAAPDWAKPKAKAAPTSIATPESVPPAATETIEAAAARGDSVAQFHLGLARLEAGDSELGLNLLKRAANQGLAVAQYRLAKLHERGEGMSADLVQARQWTERAAAAGNVKAMHDLGVYYAKGEGAPFDEAAAFRWFRQAADLGVAKSQFNLGLLYAQGRGVPANASEAGFWFLVAARNGETLGTEKAAEAIQGLDPATVAQIRARAEKFQPKPASPRANGEFGPLSFPLPNAAAAGSARSG